MRERLVESWLTSASERSFEVPFAQLLISRGHTVLSAPAHHPFEHGKDLLSRDPEGGLCAFQLKAGSGSFTLSDLEKHQVQLHALATTAVRHASLKEPTLPASVFLVTNQVLTPPARDRLTSMSEGLMTKGYPAVQPLERDQLLSWFLAAHGSYFPQEPERVSTFLEVFLESGRGPFPKAKVLSFIASQLPWKARAKRAHCRRALSSAALMMSYMVEPWQRSDNHLGVAEAWILFCSQIGRDRTTTLGRLPASVLGPEAE